MIRDRISRRADSKRDRTNQHVNDNWWKEYLRY